MKTLLLSFFLSFLFVNAFSQIDGYLSEYGTNGSTLVKINKITKEVVYNYSFCDEVKDICIFTDLSKIILVDVVTIHFDESGNMVTRERENNKSQLFDTFYIDNSNKIREKKKKKITTTIVDSFYYDSSNRLSEISSTSILDDQETNVGRTEYTYGDNGRVASVLTTYKLSNGLTKCSVVKNVYNSKNQLAEVWKQSNLSKLMMTEKYYYDKKGRVKKMDSFNFDYSTKFKYHRRKTYIISNNPNEYYHISTLYYNSHHKCRKYIYGDQLDEFYYNADGTMSESKSHYDGNMVSITQHHYYKD